MVTPSMDAFARLLHLPASVLASFVDQNLRGALHPVSDFDTVVPPLDHGGPRIGAGLSPVVSPLVARKACSETI